MKALAGKTIRARRLSRQSIFKGLAREAALKLLELTDGGMIAAYDSPLGFRHGPKTIVNDSTLVVIFLSNDAYTRATISTCWTRSGATAARRRARDLPAAMTACRPGRAHR